MLDVTAYRVSLGAFSILVVEKGSLRGKQFCDLYSARSLILFLCVGNDLGDGLSLLRVEIHRYSLGQQRACRSPLLTTCAPKGHLCCRCECLTTSFSVRCPMVKQSGLGSALVPVSPVTELRSARCDRNWGSEHGRNRSIANQRLVEGEPSRPRPYRHHLAVALVDQVRCASSAQLRPLALG
jgi:hypothetical protein